MINKKNKILHYTQDNMRKTKKLSMFERYWEEEKTYKECIKVGVLETDRRKQTYKFGQAMVSR